MQLVQRVLLGLVDLTLGELVVGDRVKALDPDRDVAVGNALDFQLVHTHEIGDLLEGQRRIVHQPDGGCLGVQQFCHLVSPYA